MPPIPPSLLLFARVPEAGRVKTRLEPALGAQGAARLYRAFLEDAARCYGPPAPWAGVLCVDSDPGSAFLGARFPPPWRREAQSDGDLGARLEAAFRREFRRRAPAAVAVGSDHPALPRRRMEEAFAELRTGRQAVVIPAADGGYCAIGLAAGSPLPKIFRQVPWSSATLLSVTLERFESAGLRFAVLPASYDVDRPEDLARLRAEVAARDPSEPDYPSSTAAVLESLAREGAF